MLAVTSGSTVPLMWMNSAASGDDAVDNGATVFPDWLLKIMPWESRGNSASWWLAVLVTITVTSAFPLGFEGFALEPQPMVKPLASIRATVIASVDT